MAFVLEQEESNENSGGSNSITWTSTPASGDRLVTCIAGDKNRTSFTQPTGYTLLNDYFSTDVSGGMAHKESDGTEGTDIWGVATAGGTVVWFGQYSGDISEFDVAAEDDSGAGSVTEMSSGITGSLNDTVSLAVACWGGDSKGNFMSGLGYDNSFSEVYENGGGGGDAFLAVAHKDVAGSIGVECEFSTTDTGDQMFGMIAVFNDGNGPAGGVVRRMAGLGGIAGFGGIAGIGGGLAG